MHASFDEGVHALVISFRLVLKLLKTVNASLLIYIIINHKMSKSVVGVNMFDESALLQDSHQLELSDATVESNDKKECSKEVADRTCLIYTANQTTQVDTNADMEKESQNAEDQWLDNFSERLQEERFVS